MAHIVPLLPGQHYHMYNRGNNRENLFRTERNYAYFLTLYARYIELVAETFAYCLLHNHFHLLVRIRPDLTPGVQPSRPFSHLFNAYARAFNQAYGRTGGALPAPVPAHPGDNRGLLLAARRLYSPEPAAPRPDRRLP